MTPEISSGSLRDSDRALPITDNIAVPKLTMLRRQVIRAGIGIAVIGLFGLQTASRPRDISEKRDPQFPYKDDFYKTLTLIMQPDYLPEPDFTVGKLPVLQQIVVGDNYKKTTVSTIRTTLSVGPNIEVETQKGKETAKEIQVILALIYGEDPDTQNINLNYSQLFVTLPERDSSGNIVLPKQEGIKSAPNRTSSNISVLLTPDQFKKEFHRYFNVPQELPIDPISLLSSPISYTINGRKILCSTGYSEHWSVKFSIIHPPKQP